MLRKAIKSPVGVSYIVAVLALVCFAWFSIFKVNRMLAVYEEGERSLQIKMEETVSKIRSDNLNLSDEKVAFILESASDRSFESGIVSWFKKYLLIFVFLFFASTLLLLVGGFWRSLKKMSG